MAGRPPATPPKNFTLRFSITQKISPYPNGRYPHTIRPMPTRRRHSHVRKPQSKRTVPDYVQAPHVFKMQVCRTVNVLRLVHGWTLAECAELFNASHKQLEHWMTQHYKWEREERGEVEIAEARFRSTGAQKRKAEYTPRQLRDVRRAMMRGCTVQEACDLMKIDRNSVAHWLLGDAFDTLLREALLADRPIRRRRVEVPQAPQKWRDMTRQVWELEYGRIRQVPGKEITERTRRLADELKGSYELNAAQRRSLELAVRHEIMAERSLTRAETLYNYELAGVPGATQAGYAWERMFVHHAEHQRRALRDAGLLDALAELPERGSTRRDKFQVVIPEN